MKDNELQFDRSCHVIYSKQCKKEILQKIALHYPPEECDAVSEISAWDNRLSVSSRGYMLGYNDLKTPSVSGFFRFLSKVGDGMMKMRIVRIDFGGKI